MRVRKIASYVAAATVLTFALAGCGAADAAPGAKAPADGGSADFAVQLNKEAAALLPESVTKSGVVSVATAPGYEPYEFKNDEGKLVGLDLDLGKALGDSLGVDFKFEEASFDSITGGIQSGRYNASLTGYVVRVERQEKVDLIDYAQSQLAILVKKDNPLGIDSRAALCGTRVGVEKGSSGDVAIQDLMASGECAEDIDLQSFPLQADAVSALQADRVDSVVGQSVSVKYVAVGSEPTKGLFELVTDEAFVPQTVGIAVDKNLPGLRDAIIEALKGLQDDGTFQAIFDKYGVGSAALPGAALNSAK